MRVGLFEENELAEFVLAEPQGEMDAFDLADEVDVLITLDKHFWATIVRFMLSPQCAYDPSRKRGSG